jgi:elongator complex protein 2
MDDCTIQLFATASLQDKEFKCYHKLSGHEDWSQTLNVTKDLSGDVLLASGSQDSFVRVWRLAKVSQERALAERRKISDLSSDEDIKAKEVIVTTGTSRV